MMIALFAVVVFFWIRSEGRLVSPMNMSNLINQLGYIVILAIGMLICILTGGNIDLSVGSVVAVIGAFAGRFIITYKLDVHLTMAICLGIGLFIGIWQGFWIAYVRIPAFIVTLAGMLVFRGLTEYIVDGKTISPFPPEFSRYFTGFLPDMAGKFSLEIPIQIPFTQTGIIAFNGFSLIVGVIVPVVYAASQLYTYFNRRRKGYSTGGAGALAARIISISAILMILFVLMGGYVNERSPAGVPTVLILLGVLLLVYGFFTSNTVMGRHIYAIGGNEKAARLSGVKTNALLFFAYVNMAMLASVAGLVVAARLNSATPSAGSGFELDAIAACYIGGASAYGGVGTVGGTLVGAFLMGILNNGMSITGTNQYLQKVIKGLVLLAAVAFDVISKKQTALPSFGLAFKRRPRVHSVERG
jgi:putative multiple sugar transport system permease protein